MVKTPPFHGGVTSSILVRAIRSKIKKVVLKMGPEMPAIMENVSSNLTLTAFW